MVELKKDDAKTLIGLVSEEIDKVGEARRKQGFHDSDHFYHLIDIRNKLLAMPLDEEPPLSINGEEWRELPIGRRLSLVERVEVTNR